MMDRRLFLQGLLQISAAGLALSGCTSTRRRESTGLTSKTAKGSAYFCIADTDDSSVLRVMNWDDGTFTDHVLPLGYPHSIIQHPDDPQVLYSFEAFGSLAKFDLSGRTISRVDHLNTPSMFDGHGVLTQSKTKLVCTEFDHAHSTILTVRDATSLDRLFVAPEDCSQSHQVVSLPGTSIVACANLTGRRGSQAHGGITFYDYEKNVVLNRVDFDDPVIHLTAISSSEVLGVSRSTAADPQNPIRVSTTKKSIHNLMSIQTNTLPAAGPVCYASLEGGRKTYWDDSRKSVFTGSFGIAGVPGSNSFLSSHYQAGSVIFWKDSKIAHVFDAPGAMNLVVSADGSEFMALGKGKVLVFSLETFKKIRTVSYDKPILLVGNFRGSYG